MKSALGFDPRQHDYGPATDAVRQILLDWESIDWVAPTKRNRLDETMSLVRKHHELGHAYAPELFSACVEVQCRAGGWPEFIATCTHVRTRTGWDWKFSALKPLAIAHARACGWNLDEQVAHNSEAAPRPGDLFVRVCSADPPFVMWRGLGLPIAELEARRSEPAGEAADFYLRYAHSDAIHCIEWQLAEGSNDLSKNPFVPLLGCYRAGFHPFGMSRESMLLFEFTTATMPERPVETTT
jgi:hypothetical protein